MIFDRNKVKWVESDRMCLNSIYKDSFDNVIWIDELSDRLIRILLLVVAR